MNSIDREKQALLQLAGKNRYEVMTEFTAIFTGLVEAHGIIPVVVGGLAVSSWSI